MTQPESTPRDVAAEALTFAKERLGPVSERHLSSAETQALVVSRVRAGAALEDAVLGVLHRAATDDRALANEFIAYFLADLMRLGRNTLGDGLRQFLDSGDLVQSVLGDLWKDLAAVSFDTRARFISLLSQRLTWKAADRAKGMKRAKRSEDKRVHVDPAELDKPDSGPTPSVHAARGEERDQMILLLMRLPDRDRKLLTLKLKGESLEDIAREMDMNPEAARKAVQRAMRKVRQLASEASDD